MMICTFQRLQHLLLLVLCCYIPSAVSVQFMSKDIMMAILIGRLLKPRFIPLPIPIPIKIPFTKTTIKRYPVPYRSHSFEAQSVGSYPWMSGVDNDELSSASGAHALAHLHSASENIDSLVQQLSLSPDVIKASDSHDAPTSGDIDIDLENYLNFQDGDEWWRR